jgi:hypothetical protein
MGYDMIGCTDDINLDELVDMNLINLQDFCYLLQKGRQRNWLQL